MMYSFLLLAITCPIFNVLSFTKMQSNATLFKQKRSLRLPEGSSFVLTLQLLKAIQIKEPSPINLALEFDVSWKIPNESKLLVKRLSQRHRRELYANFELALNSQKLPGKVCLLRSICETKFLLNPEGVSFIEDILHVIFRYPPDPEMKLDEYHIAYQNTQKCDLAYPCPFSLINLILSYNS